MEGSRWLLGGSSDRIAAGQEHGILADEHHFSTLVNGCRLTEHEAHSGREASSRIEVAS
jgi:hypothetical protein